MYRQSQIPSSSRKFSGSDFCGTVTKGSTKKLSGVMLAPSRIPSAIKSVNRNVLGRNPSFSSAHKKSTSLMFGVTPQRNRLFQQPASTSRISRSSFSNRANQENRSVSDPNFQKECQEKILGFLTENNYPHPISKQALSRLSLSDASKIFEFLLNFFFNDVVIKNGFETSLDIVVSRYFPLLGYLYTIKKSDLTSFSSGRQLGVVLSMLEYLVDLISYVQNLDLTRLVKSDVDFQMSPSDDDNIGMEQILPKLLNLSFQYDFENLKNEDKRKLIDEFCQDSFGNSDEIEKLEQDAESRQQRALKLEQEYQYLSELPQKIEEIQLELSRCQQYIQEMIEHNDAKCKIENALKQKIDARKDFRQKLSEELKNVEKVVDLQKDSQIEYKYAIDRRKQINDEIEHSEAQNREIESRMSILNLENNELRIDFEKLVTDVEEILTNFLHSFNNSKIHQFIPDLNGLIEKDKEWQTLMTHLKKLKSLEIEKVEDQHLNELRGFGEFFNKIINNLKTFLWAQNTKLKNLVSVKLLCAHQNQEESRDRVEQELTEQKVKLQTTLDEKNETLAKNQAELLKLNDQIDSMRRMIQDTDKKLDNEQVQISSLGNKINDLQKEIQERKDKLMIDFQKTVSNGVETFNRTLKRIDNIVQPTEKQNRSIEKVILKF